MGGGEGMGPVKRTTRALGKSLFDKELGEPIGQLDWNKTLSSSLQTLEWKMPVKV
jgi:1,2-diacylglycerol 3-beta-galactosyltransferase